MSVYNRKGMALIVVSMSSSHVVGHGFAPQPGDTKVIIKMVQTASLLGKQALG